MQKRRRREGTTEHLKASGLAVTVVDGVHKETLAQTRAAMEAGADIIVQGAFPRGGAGSGARTDHCVRPAKSADAEYHTDNLQSVVRNI